MATTPTVTVIGNGYFTNDAEYVVICDGAAIRRGDGMEMRVPSDADAHDVAHSLAAGDLSDADYEWSA